MDSPLLAMAEVSMIDRRGWFADYDDDPGSDWHGLWRPYLQLDGICLPLHIGFDGEEACGAFIRDDVIGKGSLNG